jgi:hypothetical protein
MRVGPGRYELEGCFAAAAAGTVATLIHGPGLTLLMPVLTRLGNLQLFDRSKIRSAEDRLRVPSVHKTQSSWRAPTTFNSGRSL